jgi:hypothetical protein
VVTGTPTSYDLSRLGAQAYVRDVLKMFGLQDSLIFLNKYDAARIEQF